MAILAPQLEQYDPNKGMQQKAKDVYAKTQQAYIPPPIAAPVPPPVNVPASPSKQAPKNKPQQNAKMAPQPVQMYAPPPPPPVAPSYGPGFGDAAAAKLLDPKYQATVPQPQWGPGYQPAPSFVDYNPPDALIPQPNYYPNAPVGTNVPIGDLGPGLQQKAVDTLAKYPGSTIAPDGSLVLAPAPAPTGGFPPAAAPDDGGGGGGGGNGRGNGNGNGNGQPPAIAPGNIPADLPAPDFDIVSKISQLAQIRPGERFEIPPEIQAMLQQNGISERMLAILRLMGFQGLNQIGPWGFNSDFLAPTAFQFGPDIQALLASMGEGDRYLVNLILNQWVGGPSPTAQLPGASPTLAQLGVTPAPPVALPPAGTVIPYGGEPAPAPVAAPITF